MMHTCNETSPYGNSELYCRVCGMDIGFRPVKKKKGKRTFYYCCEECANADKD